jgi:3-dehydroquinate synthase II/3-amino-4-hydroxybenzoic acid synthase
LWFDLGSRTEAFEESLLARVLETEYTGLIATAACFEELRGTRFQRLTRVLQVEDMGAWESLALAARLKSAAAAAPSWVVASADDSVLAAGSSLGVATCLRVRVEGGADLDRAIAVGARHDYVMLHFKDPTNIPLEIVIAEFQSRGTAVLKEIGDPDALEDIAATLGTMEVGADGIVCSPRSTVQLDRLLTVVREQCTTSLQLEPARILESRHIGMGHRACIDLVTLFEPTEGLLVGSTSRGAILCCAEVFHLPYMERRPFRVNAGGIHSYVFGPQDRTNYLSELRGGSPSLVVATSGSSRIAAVGRIKIEVRPLRLISCVFATGEPLAIILQDDWHVRVFGGSAEARNITELRAGDEVLAHRSTSGRHVGVRVSESIWER